MLRAARAAAVIARQGKRLPVLAVNATNAVGPSRPSAMRIRRSEPNTAAVVVLPYVRPWRDVPEPLMT